MPKFLIGFCLFAIVLLTARLSEEATIFLVRHAEKDGGVDPTLSEVGRERAAYYGKYFAARGVTRIFSTDFRRTRDTAAQLASAVQADIEIYDHRADEQPINYCARDEVLLIVGHSNTTPELAASISGLDVPSMDDSEYNVGYKVTCGGHTESSVEALDLTLPSSRP